MESLYVIKGGKASHRLTFTIAITKQSYWALEWVLLKRGRR